MAPAPPTSPSIKVSKTFLYRGSTTTWSNRYFFDGATPSDSAHWTTLSDAVVTAEKAALPTTVTIVQTQGYAPGSDVPVFSKTYATAGTAAMSGAPQATGDSAILVRYSTSAKTSKNHPIYLFNYYHGVYAQSATAGDDVYGTLYTNHGTYAALWVTGFSDGAVTHHRCGPYGHVATGALVNAKIHHRDFPS